ncbi:MAG: hypothetical protein WA208_20270 [Thermoanaerobaculia bacterium]
MKDRDADDTDSIDDLILSVEAQLRMKPATTSLILRRLDTIAWEVARMEEAIRAAPTGVITRQDAKTFTKAFGRMRREAETLTMWLRSNPLELPRN